MKMNINFKVAECDFGDRHFGGADGCFTIETNGEESVKFGEQILQFIRITIPIMEQKIHAYMERSSRAEEILSHLVEQTDSLLRNQREQTDRFLRNQRFRDIDNNNEKFMTSWMKSSRTTTENEHRRNEHDDKN